MILSFELTMPNVGSWNGKWSGSEKKYFIIRNVSKKWFDSQEHFKRLKEKGSESWHYSWGDGWGANVSAEIIDAREATKRRKMSKGFCGYDWMVESIIYHGTIMTETDRKRKALQTA